jgi:hypothetical protein
VTTPAVRKAMAAFNKARKTSRFVEMERKRERRPLAFRGILVAVLISLFLWWLIYEVLK